MCATAMSYPQDSISEHFFSSPSSFILLVPASTIYQESWSGGLDDGGGNGGGDGGGYLEDSLKGKTF